MGYTPTTWQDDVTPLDAAHMNHIEDGIAAFYPQTQIIAPEQTVTITAETDPEAGEPIVLAEGYELPEALPEDWTVTVNGTVLNYHRGAYVNVGGTTGIAVALAENKLILSVNNGPDPASATPIPGDYTVKITKGAPARIPAVAAFPVSAGSGNVKFVIDAPKEDVDAAMENGCVLLYPAAPSNNSGIAFGCLVGSVIYYASVGEKIAWVVSNVTLNDGKYVVRGLG